MDDAEPDHPPNEISLEQALEAVARRLAGVTAAADGFGPLPASKKIGTAMHEYPLPSSSPPSIEPITMRVPDACRFTGISRSTLYLLIARGEVEVIKLGSATLVLTDSLRQLIERNRNVRSSLNSRMGPIGPRALGPIT